MNLIKADKPVSFYVEQVLASIHEGWQNPLDIHINKAKLEKILQGISEHPEINEAIVKEFQKYGERTVNYKGALLQQQESGVKYDFSSCGDPLMEEYQKQLKSLNEKIKERAKFLKTIPVSGTIEPGTGTFIYPPVKSSKTIIKTTLK